VGLVAGGLVLAAIKIVPALGLAAWLLAERDGTRTRSQLAVPAMLTAAAILVALTLPVLVIDPGALADTIAAQGNLEPWPGGANLAPAVRVAPLIGLVLATVLSRVVGLAILAFVVIRRLDGPGGFVLAAIAPLLLAPQLWSHWLIVPAIAALVACQDWPPLRALDRRLRLAWLGATVRPRDAAST
jgi:hypothetical protein